MPKDDSASDKIIEGTFGGKLTQQGRGFYVALELLAICRGRHIAQKQLFPPDRREPLEYARRSHDFARRLLVGEVDPGMRDRVKDAEETLRALLRGLTVPIPGAKRGSQWQNTHFFPYVGQLAHYDAVVRKNRISLERYWYRGAGALAYRLLWEDHDDERLGRVRRGLERLVADSKGPLGRLAEELMRNDAEPRSVATRELFNDVPGAATTVISTPWVENLRDCVAGIVSRDTRDVPHARQVDALMHVVPYCIAMHQLACARRTIGSPRAALVVDFGAGPGPVRQLSRESLNGAKGSIHRALESAVVAAGGATSKTKTVPAWLASSKAFFSSTLAVVGALNSVTGGLQYFKMGPQLLEGLVLGFVEEEVDLDRFMSDILHDRLGLVVDGRSATREGLGSSIDIGRFDANVAGVVAELEALGMLTRYSDATRMVGRQGR